MQVDLVRVDRSVDLVRVHVLVTLHSGQQEPVTVTLPNQFAYVRNFAGWIQDVAGKWHSPFRPGKKDNWEPYIDPTIKWAQRPVTDEEYFDTAVFNLAHYNNREVVDHCGEVGFGEYTDLEYKIRIIPKGPVHINEEGFVQVTIEAFDSDTDEPLWVEDGNWAFHNLDPMWNGKFDAANKLRKALARRVREEQP